MQSIRIHIMFAVATFGYDSLSHHNRQIREEHSHHATRIPQMEHFVFIQFSLLITLQLLVEPLVHSLGILIPVQHAISRLLIYLFLDGIEQVVKSRVQGFKIPFYRIWVIFGDHLRISPVRAYRIGRQEVIRCPFFGQLALYPHRKGSRPEFCRTAPVVRFHRRIPAAALPIAALFYRSYQFCEAAGYLLSLLRAVCSSSLPIVYIPSAGGVEVILPTSSAGKIVI